MNNEHWQQLLALESRDITTKWFQQLHKRELSARRAWEINSAAKQGREYFRNASSSDFSVRPLLTFYGVACLSRCLTLLLKPSSGEESLGASHGLETCNWGAVLSGDVAAALTQIGQLKIRTTRGLFTEFLTQTQNRICIHIHSAGVDWAIGYDAPKQGTEVSLNELFSRLPDLRRDYSNVSAEVKYAGVSELRFTGETGLEVVFANGSFESFRTFFDQHGYSYEPDSKKLKATTATVEAHSPQFVHTYATKIFDAIPGLHIAEPFAEGACFSQLGLTYLTGYFLGMLVRYYPTHWVALINGEKGDAWWPVINRAQHMVEIVFPELVIELVEYLLKQEPK